jgi:hypothetical protein
MQEKSLKIRRIASNPRGFICWTGSSGAGKGIDFFSGQVKGKNKVALPQHLLPHHGAMRVGDRTGVLARNVRKGETPSILGNFWPS